MAYGTGDVVVHRNGGEYTDYVSSPVPSNSSDHSGVRILVIDDEETLRESCASVLRVEGYQVSVCGRGEEALQLVKRGGYDVVMIDLCMTQVPGQELLRACLQAKPDTLVIMMTGNPTLNSAIDMLREGAWDYLPKPFSAAHLQVLTGRAAHLVTIAREAHAQRRDISTQHGHSDKLTILGSSPAFQNAINLARKVATTDASVFITGESGTGKEMIAQFIHQHSRRSGRPLVAVNCAALPETLLESEMFGHVKGSFTGAIRDKAGLLEAANGGTLFLDELTEMSMATQAKLLRVLQDGMVRRVGSESVDAMVNVRFLAATNREPEQALEEGVLRRDLYYRLRVVPIRVPPLRERPTDIPLLASYFLAHYWTRHRDRGAQPPFFSQGAIDVLQQHSWPGNVRELQNVIEHAVVLLEPGAEITPSDIPFLDGPTVGYSTQPVSMQFSDEQYHVARERLIATFEQGYLGWLVDRAAGNMSKAARIAGVDRTTLYRLMEKHDLHRDTRIKTR
ncbi:MAG TPA: sigma-54 dependent transcriptional regulator [Longimicrobiales bacterium]